MPPDPLLDDPTHGGVTDADLEAFFNSHPGLRPLSPLNGADPAQPVAFQSGQGRVVPPSGGLEADDLSNIDDATTQQQPAPQSPTSEPAGDGQPAPSADDSGSVGDGSLASPPSPTDFIDFEGTSIPASRLRALLQLGDDIERDTQLRDLITGHVVGRVAPTEEGGAPATSPAEPSTAGAVVPEGLDLEDPAIRVLWDRLQAQESQIAGLTRGVQSSHDATLARARVEAQSQFNTASENFRTKHGLEAADIETLASVAARLGVIPSLMQGVDPITGVPVRPDPISAAERALEIAYYTVPEYRQRAFAASVHQQQDDAERKKKLAAVGGSNGSVQRVQSAPQPGTPEARSAMIAEVGQMMTGEWTGDNN